MSSSSSLSLMKPLMVRKAKVTYPTGDPNFSVLQPFPKGIDAELCDPFLMCDHFGPIPSTGAETNPDKFPIDWHPHRGFDLATVLLQGVGRHGDSLGNRETFQAPGLQWISAGSGIEHAEAGGTPAGGVTEGFQIWINVPSSRKMDDPRYGTHGAGDIPTVVVDDATIQVLAGSFESSSTSSVVGPFVTVQPVMMLNVDIHKSKGRFSYSIPSVLNNVLIYVYSGGGEIVGEKVPLHHVIRLDATQTSQRDIVLQAGVEGMKVMIFAGKRLDQPIAQHGPFVMTTQAEIQLALSEYRQGTFLKKRAPWNYKRIVERPTDWCSRNNTATSSKASVKIN